MKANSQIQLNLIGLCLPNKVKLALFVVSGYGHFSLS